MDKDTEQRLIALNQRFYDDFASAFSDSRAATEPGLEQVIAQIQPNTRVLDLGCGQARLARLLPPSCSYVGVDNSEAMLQIAAARPFSGQAQLVLAEIVRDRWEDSVGEPFNWAVLRAVLHHIPGYDNRLSIVRRAGQVLVPGGRMIVANWQFLKIARLRRRILDWSVVGLTSDSVDLGDALLDWARDGRGMRYAHLIDEAETQRLAHDANLRVLELFYADGHTNDLTLYAVLERT